MKKRGFTLIELLAVIVILAIIALIATPLVLKYIEKARSESTIRSAENYLYAVENSIINKIMDNPTFKPNSCDVQSDGNLKCNGIDVKVEIKGEMPSSGTITIENEKIKDIILMFDNKIIEKQNNKLVYLKSGLYDSEGNLIASWDELVNDYGIDLEKDYADETGQPTIDDLSKLPGSILSQGILSKGKKLVIDSSIKKLGKGSLGINTTLEEVVILNGVTSIERTAFYGSTGLTSIKIPNSVTSIGDFAFEKCASLTTITIPNSVTSIGKGVFMDCTSLTSIIIPNSVTSIERTAFYGSTNLTEIRIPETVTSIGDYAFYGCKNLKNINYVGTQENWNSISFGANWNQLTHTNMVINYNYVMPQN